MGTFMGHFLPGTFFTVFAIWWTVSLWCRYERTKKKKTAFHSTVTYPCTCLPGRLKHWEIEGIFKIFFCAVGITGEIATGWRGHGHIIDGNVQHLTMFIFFGMSGVFDLLKSTRFIAMPSIQYIVYILAFIVEGLLFSSHGHGDKLEMTVHRLLLLVICCCVISSLFEMIYPHMFLATLARTYFVFLQGTWFVHIGFVLYPPISGIADKLDHNGDGTVMLTTAYFTWHAGIIFLLMLLIGHAVRCCSGSARDCGAYDVVTMHSLLKPMNNNGQHTILTMDSDLESDDEIQQSNNAHTK